MENVFRIAFTKRQAKAHLIGYLLTNHILTFFHAPECTLSNGENRKSLSLYVLKLFEKWPRPLFFKGGIHCPDFLVCCRARRVTYILNFLRVVDFLWRSYRIYKIDFLLAPSRMKKVFWKSFCTTFRRTRASPWKSVETKLVEDTSEHESKKFELDSSWSKILRLKILKLKT